MKATAAAALVAALLCETASAHYIWQTVNGGAAYQYFRQNSNYNSPVTDTTSTDIRCNVGASAGGQTQIGTLSVAAGSKLTLGLDTAVYHQGPLDFYLGRVPSGETADSWDGSGVNWFKFQYDGPTFTGSGTSAVASWPMSISYDVTIPASLPAGQWLLRAEQIGIHNPAGAPQFYVGCAQLQVTGGGSCSPPYFAIPGHITATDPGITVNIYSNFYSYTPPGPAVFNCAGGSSNPAPTTLKTSTTAIRTTGGTSSTTLRTTTGRVTTTASTTAQTTASKTTTASGAGQTLYGQCGGTGWTGPTTCASGTCKANGAYYSQCTP